MVTVPGFLLRRLYVNGSLTNTDDGFQFEILNSLASGYAHKVHPLTVDGAEVPAGASEFDFEGIATRFEDVSNLRPLTLALNRRVTVRVSGTRLEPGERRIGMAFDAPGLGTLRFDFTDTVEDA